MTSRSLTFSARKSRAAPTIVRVTTPGAVVEHCFTPQGDGYDFAWSGESTYIAWHDIVMEDGEMSGDNFSAVRRRDLRHHLTFFPRGVRAKGWSAPAARTNCYAALYLDEHALAQRLGEDSEMLSAAPPNIYFQNADLAATMSKLARLLRTDCEAAPRILIESLTLTAAAELAGALRQAREEPRGLNQAQLAAARAYIEAHACEDVSLDDIAAAARLSPYHFSRAFKQSTGVTPYRFLLETRIERAKALIAKSTRPLSEIALEVGFGSPSQFSRTFADIVGTTPRAYRAAK